MSDNRVLILESQRQRLRSVRLLAGGLAHRLNNFLTVARGHAQLLSIGQPTEQDLAESVSAIDEATRGAAGVAERLLTFGQLQGTGQRVDLHEVIQAVGGLVAVGVSPGVEVRQVLAADGSEVAGDVDLIAGALLALGLSAAEAAQEGGRITYATQSVELKRAFCRASPFDVRPGRHILISVADMGRSLDGKNVSGILDSSVAAEDLADEQERSLAGVCAAVRDCRGAVAVESLTGGQTSVQIYLPLA